MPNRLAKESSPYLLQHAHNPVDWYPWGPEAFERARRENKPVLLSIGYSACHWCHVMERESFEDADTARLMNELFVNVKVDREERPDVDAIYMQAVQAMTGHGGWPMTTFLTPELVPFWGGTYFPPVDSRGMPSFRRVLLAVADAYASRSEDVARMAESMRRMYEASRERGRSAGKLTPDVLDRAARGLLAQHDPAHGGFGDAPKFPHAMALDFLLQRWARTGNEAARNAARHSFLSMARGGIHDQVGGGFARYAVDAAWLVPHFEKMLYDNALLLRLGVHLLQADDGGAGADEIRDACDGIVEWLADEMIAPGGGFYSAIDADSEGHEGRFYVWDEAEIREALRDDAPALLAYWGVTAAGNFEGKNILFVSEPGRRPPRDQLERGRRALRHAREARVRPARDDKILASWNGLMLRALAEYAMTVRTAGASGRDAHVLAERNASFLAREMVRDERVLRSHKDGVSRIPGFLEDHAAVAAGFLSMYELSFDRTWLERARQLAQSILEWFWDDADGTLYDTAADHEALIVRPCDVTDNATPSGTSMTAELLLRLADLLGDTEMARRANHLLERLAPAMAQHPLAFGNALCAADMAVHGAVEIAIVGDPADSAFQALAAVAWSTPVPSRVLAGGLPGHARGIALLQDREMLRGKPTAYVCRGYACEQPVTEPVGLWDQLVAASGIGKRADSSTLQPR